MPLRKFEIFRPGGGSYEASECPLGKFKIDIPAGGGCYTSDPVEACLGNPEWGVPGCNFVDLDAASSDLEKACRCPPDMTWDKYNKLREQYTATPSKHTKKGFQEFVKENYKPLE